MSFYSPLYLILILGLIPLILMYLLKKEHEDIVLSSNYLWDKMLRDMEANKPWQKLRNNLLLILQIILFTLIVLALARPQIFKGSINSDNLIIVLDKSASMKNKDINGITRFEKAKEEIEDLIKSTKANTKTTLISMDNKPNILISNSRDKSVLKKKLNEIVVNDSSDNIKDTLSIVKALIKDTDNYDLVFFTDKEIDTDIDNLKVNKINEKETNISLDNMSYSKNDKNITALTTVTNHSNREQSFDISIYGDDQILDVQEVKLKAKESRDIYFDNVNKNTNVLKAEIDIEDSLDVDNSRYLVINSDPIKKVLIVSEKGNIFLEKAIGINENIEVYKSNEKLPNDLKGYDVYIFDGKVPKDIPKDGNIVMFNPNNNNLFNVSNGDKNGEIKLINDELFKYVNLDFYIDKTNVIEKTNWLRPILTLNDKPVIAKGIRDNQKMVVVGFDIRNTDLPLKIDFPIFIQNILDYTLNINTQEKVEVLAGENIDINILPKSKQVNIINPKGEKQKITSPSYSNTSYKGVYTIEQVTDDETLKSYFVSNIDTSKESIDIKETHEGNLVKNDNQYKVRTGKDIRNLILILALIVISLEWVVYNRGY
ncbi:vWA domain-containing protein [Tissierella creatinophila]|uniref:VWFA domain-containing protein n=1 Tax=Tissierella creatinophila DSM 6911 TaxID=1123403 RepID=A0A1U7M7H2_TISCR|nr:VWA domain-containing protein [Tissierella creatinophila]OLS03273.1 hypothetical protein TICRE_07010 [Tissierella creatinophila DSM 6911]